MNLSNLLLDDLQFNFVNLLTQNYSSQHMQNSQYFSMRITNLIQLQSVTQ